MNSPDKKFVWNQFLMQPLLEQLEVDTRKWMIPVVHGFIGEVFSVLYLDLFLFTLPAIEADGSQIPSTKVNLWPALQTTTNQSNA